ncbi:VENN motif pre-toxin domain-containing protein [Erwiniaceae bacterium CAU 1747]
MQGLAGGDLKAAIAGASAPYLAEVIKQTAPDEASRVMAHAAVAGVIAAAQGNSAAAGAAGAATTAIMGEAIKKALYGDVPVSQLDEEQKQTLVTLGTLAAGFAGGLTGGSAGDAVAGAQAGQNEISNNMVSMGMLQQMLAQETLNSAAMAEAGKGNANDEAALALTKKVKEGLDAACLQNVSCVLMAVVEAQQHTDGTGSKTETLPVNDDLTGGKLENPGHQGEQGNSLTTPDQRDQNGASHTGNGDGAPDISGNILVNPGSDPLTKKDVIYLSENSNSKIDTVINETLSGKKNFTSSITLSSDEALAAGLKFLGTGYKEIGKPGSGVYHSADGTKEFRIDSGSIGGAHAPGVPHVHFGVKNPTTGKYISNNHVPYKD